ncbi:glycosyltransferase [Bacillus sp. 7894-2]|uniref:glycosyltransferase n=1 Tax=Bacillus sp. 7894-2 TaxID=2021695 RepID=UPI0015CC4EC7|nr:glycosyltransferase [Bacillus sp. 7894-2]
MKVLHLNAGNETGGGMYHILDLLETLSQKEFFLGVFEKGPMFERAFKRGINIQLFPQKTKYDFSLIAKVVQFIDENKIDIIHTHGARANLFGYLIKRKRPHCMWVTTVHSNPFHDFLGKGIAGRVFTKVHLLTLKKPDHYFAISSRFKELLVSQGIKENKITTIFNGIDFSCSHSSIELSRGDIGLEEEQFVIIMVARLTPVKGHVTAFAALKKVIDHYPDVKLLLVGDGFLEEDLRRQAKEMGLTQHILFLGYREDVVSLWQLSDLKILTSYSESFPLVLLEAARAKLPVITTDVGGVGDLVPSNKYGWVIPVKDYDQLALAINEAIDLKHLGKLQEKGNCLNERASSLFNVENFRKSVIDTYKKLTRLT